MGLIHKIIYRGFSDEANQALWYRTFRRLPRYVTAAWAAAAWAAAVWATVVLAALLSVTAAVVLATDCTGIFDVSPMDMPLRPSAVGDQGQGRRCCPLQCYRAAAGPQRGM